MNVNNRKDVSALTEQQGPEPKRIVKKIGSTTYELFIYFSKTSRENLNDKIMRLIKNDAQRK
jgi:hypothetical protein